PLLGRGVLPTARGVREASGAAHRWLAAAARRCSAVAAAAAGDARRAAARRPSESVQPMVLAGKTGWSLPELTAALVAILFLAVLWLLCYRRFALTFELWQNQHRYSTIESMQGVDTMSDQDDRAPESDDDLFLSRAGPATSARSHPQAELVGRGLGGKGSAQQPVVKLLPPPPGSTTGVERSEPYLQVGLPPQWDIGEEEWREAEREWEEAAHGGSVPAGAAAAGAGGQGA
ncbi:unnamed protein product, partial [Prorocentrum cordatum]